MTFFADHADQLCVPILANERLAKDTYRVRLDAPQMALRAIPGQFFMLRIAQCNDPLIGRALALFGRDSGLELVYLVKGKFTTRLSQLSTGDMVFPMRPWTI
jgi:dihydroorotate dehydrogenase electron transfer subunit